MEHKALWFHSLPVRFNIIQVLVAIFMLISSLLVVISFQKNQLLSQQKIIDQSNGKLAVANLNDFILNISGVLQSIANVASNRYATPQQLTEVINSLLQQNISKKIINSGYVKYLNIDIDDIQWRKNKNTQFDFILSKVNTSQEELSIIKNIPKNKNYWKIVHSDSTENIITIASSIWSNNNIIGFASININLDNLMREVDNLNEAIPGYIVIFNLQDNMVLSQNKYIHLTDGKNDLTEKLNQAITFSKEYSYLNRMLDESINKVIKIYNSKLSLNSDLVINKVNFHKNIDSIKLQLLNFNWPASLFLLNRFSIVSDPILQQKTNGIVFLMADTYWRILYVSPMKSVDDEVLGIANEIGVYLLLLQLLALIILFIYQHKIFISPLTKMVNVLTENRTEQLEIDAKNKKDEFGILAQAFISRNRQLETALASLDASNMALEQQLLIQEKSQMIVNEYYDKLHCLFRLANNLIYIKDLNGTYIFANDKYCEIVGKEKSMVIGTSDQLLFEEELADIYRKNDNRTFQVNDGISFEEKFVTNQGIVTYQSNKFILKDSDDNKVGIGTIAYDISNRILKENKYNEVNKYLTYLNEKNKNKIASLFIKLNKLKKNYINVEKKLHICRKEAVWINNRHELLHNMLEVIITKLRQEQDDILRTSCSQSDVTNSQIFTELLSKQTEKLRRYYQILQDRHQPTKSVEMKKLILDLVLLTYDTLNNMSVKSDLEKKFKNNILVQGETLPLIHFFLTLFNYIIKHSRNTNQLKNIIVDLNTAILGDYLEIKVTTNLTCNSLLIDDKSDSVIEMLKYWISYQCNGELFIELNEKTRFLIVVKLLIIS